ncbi:MAG: purine-nucleoside phosphorylase [Acholeplasmatales bacterium]|nr:purine-nucleoside phosphorylase [Acholeplasmatales bacterium]
MSNIPTPHNSCDDASKIAKVVLMPGDPLRAKYIADNYLTDVEQFNHIRNIYGYTGLYNGKRISIMASGMGQASISVYAYELFKFYDVDTIVRIGTAGSYDEKIKTMDTVLVTSAYSESTLAKVAYGFKNHVAKPSLKINNKLEKIANELNIPLKKARCHSSDAFYSTQPDYWKTVRDEHECQLVEMESFALFQAAKATGKNAACLLTISDSFVSSDYVDPQVRQTGLNNMFKIALGLASKK